MAHSWDLILSRCLLQNLSDLKRTTTERWKCIKPSSGWVILKVKVANINSMNMEVEQSQSPATNCSTLSIPSSVEDETNNVMPCSNRDDNRGDNYLAFCRNAGKSSSANFLNDSINCSES
ncbi:VIN3-like protein 2 [Forsythia ovata]|uniref:VIN3-like protein 2 n=1 Tax=Forsythia ovata TaxID=205694 RepID=A0ABD1QC05_9LAMI